MGVDDSLRRAAQQLRLSLTEEDIPAPPKTKQRPWFAVALGALVTLIVIGGIAVLARDVDPTVGGPEPPATSQPSPPSGWEAGRSAEVGVDYWIPEDGWRVIEESLTPDLSGLPPTFQERTKGTIIAFATFPAEPGSPTVFCSHRPQTALEQLGPHDALISVREQTEAVVPEFPERRRATGIYEGSPEELYPYIGEINNDSCYDRANEGRAAQLFYREYAYNDQGRAFIISVAIGEEVSKDLQRQVWWILDSLEYQPATQQ